MNLKIFVVIVNWNRAADTIECLKSLKEIRLENQDSTIVVVDNGSSDNSVEQIENHISNSQAVNCHILINKSNLGFAGGNNVGVRYALKNGADYVLILNNDTLVDKFFLQELIDYARREKRVGAIASKIYFAKGFEFHKKRYKKDELGKVIWSAGGDVDWDNIYGTNRGVDEVDKGQFDSESEVDFAPGTCVLYSSNALKKVGLFDEKYFLYLEDMDLSIRLKRKQFRVLYCPDSIIWHKVSQSSGIGSDLNDYFTTRNRLLFGSKYAGFRTKVALLRESFRMLRTGRKWQRIGVRDYYLKRFGKGSWK